MLFSFLHSLPSGCLLGRTFLRRIRRRAIITRRQFIISATAMVGGPLALGACSSGTDNESYKAAVRRTWLHSEGRISGGSLVQRELVRYATLAPSSHNTQCWKFRSEECAISVLPDLARRCPAVDPDDHHLFVSLGCATENLIQAALANGLKGEACFNASAADGIRVALEPTNAVVSPLFQVIPERQCTRAEFDGKPLSNEELSMLEQSGTGNGVHVLLLTEKTTIEKVLEYVVQANTAQMNDPSFVEELKSWIRFGDEEAVRTGDGLFTLASGNPSVPRWLGETHWVEAGRCYERFALQSTALGIRTAMINQPVEVSSLRPQFAAFLGVGSRRPDLVVRFGRGPRMPQSLRRPVQALLA